MRIQSTSTRYEKNEAPGLVLPSYQRERTIFVTMTAFPTETKFEKAAKALQYRLLSCPS